MGRVTARRRASHVTPDDSVARPETLVVEEPLEIRVDGRPVTVTMRTPGSDVELAQGFLLTEGVIGHRDDLLTVRYCRGTGPDNLNTYNVLDAALSPGVQMPQVDITRNFYMTSSCGVCGKASLDAVQTISRYSPGDDASQVEAHAVRDARAAARRAEGVREHGRTARRRPVRHRRRHARRAGGHRPSQRRRQSDRVGGREDRIPLSGTVLLVSGRVSFELPRRR